MIPKDITFLVIDDYETIRNMVVESLRREGFSGTINTATNGREAVNLLEKSDSNYQFVICDYMMPELDGLGVLQHTRGMDKYKNIPFLMLTAEKERTKIMNCLKSGASNYLMKPWNPKVLKEKIEFCWGKHNS